MKIKFNEQQQQIIDHVKEPISTMVVNAGAGTGKTRTLVSTLIKLVEDNICEFSEIVAITFTRKAAEEIKQRLNEATGGKYLSEIEAAYIGTIDAFCSRLLRENFLYSGIGSSFTVIQQAKQESILTHLLEVILADSPAQAVDLAFNIEIQQIKRLVIENYLQIRSSGYELQQLINKDTSDHQQFLLDQREYFKHHYIEPLLSKIEKYHDLTEIREYVEEHYLDKKERSRLLHIKNFVVDEQEKDELKSLIALLKKKLDILIDLTLDIADESSAADSRAILQIISLLHDRYEQHKQRHKLLDYQDLPSRLITMLEQYPNLQQKYRNKFKKIFVDEFQDTNNEQERIIRLLYNANLFIVGDWKQSIYGFRNAEPEIFNKYLADRENKVVDLSYNYRSSPEVIELVNTLSDNIFENAVRLIPGREDISQSEVKVFFYELAEPLADSKKQLKRYLEADLIARKILEDKERGSTVILFRKKSSMQLYEDVLNRYGINTLLVSGNDYFLRKEVQVIIDFLKVINDPFDDLSLINTLRSPLFALKDRSLLIVSEIKQKQPFYQILQKVLEMALEQSEKEKIVLFIKQLEKYRKLKDLLPLPDLIELIIEEAEYRLYAVSENNGEYILTIINKLVELAQEFDYREFLDYVQLLQLKGDDQTVDVGEDKDSVQLMTIHKAKGLEFDTVFIADMELQNRVIMETMPLEKKLIDNNIHPEIDIKDYSGQKQAGALQQTVKMIKKEKEIEEAKRLLYVAVTRAAKNLYLIVEKQEPKNNIAPFLKYGDHTLNWRIWLNYLRVNGLLSGVQEELLLSEIPSRREIQYDQKKDLSELVKVKQNIFRIEDLQNNDLFHEITANQAAKLLADEQAFIKENYWGEQTDWNEVSKQGELIHESLNRLPEFDRQSIKTLITEQKEYARYYQGLLRSGLFELIDDQTEVYRELPFIMKYDDLHITGRIDLLLVGSSGQIQVIDYKTGKHKPEYDFQLALYYDALKQVYEKATIKLKLLYLSEGRLEQTAPVADVLKKVKEKLTGKQLYQ